MRTLHLDCSALSDKAMQSITEFVSAQEGVIKIRLQTFFLEPDEDEDDPLILNVDVTDKQWSRIIVGPCDQLENAAKWLINLLIGWGEDKPDQCIGYDHTQNIVVIGNPEDWDEVESSLPKPSTAQRRH